MKKYIKLKTIKQIKNENDYKDIDGYIHIDGAPNIVQQMMKKFGTTIYVDTTNDYYKDNDWYYAPSWFEAEGEDTIKENNRLRTENKMLKNQVYLLHEEITLKDKGILALRAIRKEETIIFKNFL